MDAKQSLISAPNLDSHFRHVKRHVEHTAYITIRNSLMNYARTCLSAIGLARAVDLPELAIFGAIFGFYGVLTFTVDMIEHNNDENVKSNNCWKMLTSLDGILACLIVVMASWAIHKEFF